MKCRKLMKLPWNATIHFTPLSPSGRFYRHWLISWTVLLLRPSGQHTCFNWSYGPKSISRASPIVPQGWWECAPCSLSDNYAQCVSRASISNKYFAFALQIGKAFTILRHTIYLVLALLGTIFALSWKCFGTSWLLYGLFVVTFFLRISIENFFCFVFRRVISQHGNLEG